MKRLAFAVVAATSLIIPTAALACDGEKQASYKPATWTVADLSQKQQGAKITVLDANRPEFRAKHGVIPGAVLLTSARQYDIAKELPADKSSQLVFYCANNACRASEMAAGRALEAGYTNVAVLPEGLLGWKKAGKATEERPNT